jgi:hypothetical protein
MQRQYKLRLKNPGPRPTFYSVAEHLWGPGCNTDSDGNSATPEDPNWTELSLFLRGSSPSEQVDVDPVSVAPLVLEIRSPSQALCERVARYLAGVAGGEIEHAA